VPARGGPGVSELVPQNRGVDLGKAAALIALTIGLVALAALLYHLIEILIVLFLGIVVAATLQPWHVKLCRLGVPRGLAVLLIYFLFFAALVLIGLLVGPMLFEQVSAFAAALPEKYGDALAALRGVQSPLIRTLGQRLPPFEALTDTFAGLAPSFYRSAVGFTTGLLGAVAYFVTVFAVGFYWTMEVPRLERLVVSLVPVGRRTQVLGIWHEIESKLGAFIRGQGLAMLTIGVASAVGYALIGLPHVLPLALLAGLLEAVPLIGPILGAVPAVLVASPLGITTVLLVVGWCILLQVVENNVLIPRIMSQGVGVSALVGLFAVLAFGTVYGILGVFVAIPLTAVIQVLVDRMVINVEPTPEAGARAPSRLAGIRARLLALRQQVRRRLRERDTRMGIDPDAPDHVVDAVDQQLEEAVERVTTSITAAEEASGPIASEDPIVEKLHEATRHIEQAVERVDDVTTAPEEGPEPGAPTVELAVDELTRATQQVEQAVDRVETVIAATQVASGPIDPGERVTIVEGLDQAADEIRDAVGHVETMVSTAQESVEAEGRGHVAGGGPKP